MNKKEYIQPAMKAVDLQHRIMILAASGKDAYGMNKNLQTQEQVDDAW